MTTKALVIVALLLTGCSYEKEKAEWVPNQTRDARAWCDRLGVRVTGVECRKWADSECYVAPENGAPFRLWCNEGQCYLPTLPAR